MLVLTHAPWERPGLIAGALTFHGIPVVTRSVVQDPRPDLPHATDLAGLVVMGGPQTADDDDAHPGLPAERRLLAAAVEAGVPVLGVCLGMQLLALALGARLHRTHGTEIGFAPVEVLTADPVLADLGPAPEVLHWHSDAVELPAGARLVARSARTPVQAFRAGSALGLQFHVEVDAALLATWLNTPEMTAGLAAADLGRVASDGARVLPTLGSAAAAGLRRFAAGVRARADAR